MDGNPIQVSAERKIDILQRIHLIGSMADEYCTDKKMLASLNRALEQETKKLALTKYPLLDDDTGELKYQLAQLTSIIARFKKAKKAEQYRIASTELSEFFSRLNQVIIDTTERLDGKSDARRRFEAMLKKASTLNEKFEKKAEGGSEPPKKAIRDRDSE